MKNLNTLNDYRVRGARAMRTYGWAGDATCGLFELPSPIDGQALCVVASCGCDWEHVSVSRTNRCPNWPEMSFIKAKFFIDAETVMQLHVPSSDHVNDHPFCLHLWRPTGLEIPRPPKFMVGGMSRTEAERQVRAVSGAGA